ncbi:hypothetical protein AVEN_174991-1 [Araneus ventricosus]|uniref:RNA-directed DNA polymerase n=1 Tax=Araneus ventricosus TaxID=182803 RepID=A0A4Y2MTE2_ARAVE|nr:hypothetical protein AVEN_174991-1 [Araneus ventricosus]
MSEVSGVRTCVNSVEVELTRLNRLEVQISELTSAVQQVQSNYKRFRNASPHRRYRTRFSSRNRSFCWYHSKFGKQVQKCVPPCDFPENKDLEQVFQRLNEKGLVLNIEKCIFGADELPFLGCEVSNDGISPSKEKVEALVNYPQPQDSEAAVQVFQTCKNSIAQAALLAHRNSEAKLSLVIDASNTGIAGTLQQTYLKNTQPLAFFSRKLTPAESRYSTYDRELFAVYSSVKHFRHFLEFRDFIIYTDHEPLTFAFQQTGDKTSPRQQRHLEFISQFSTDIGYISEPHGTPLHCDVSAGNIRPYVPKAFRTTIFNVIRSLAHSGAKATANAVKQRFIWTSLKKDCTEFCKRCIPCQKSKVSRHVKSSKGDFSLPSARFSHIHLDVVDPLPPSKGYRYCLKAVDRFTHWPDVFAMIDQQANTNADFLLWLDFALWSPRSRNY